MDHHIYEVEPGIRLHYYDEGQGLPILFVPGWCFSADVFLPQIAQCSKHYRCIAVDPRCHGRSTVTYQGNTYAQQGRDLAALIAGLGLKHVVLVGWSFGAIACWEYVKQFGATNVAAMITLDNSPRSISDDPAEYRAGSLEGLRADHQNSLCSPEAFRQFMGGFADGLLYEGPMDAALREELIDTACGIPCEIADALYVDGWLADERETVHMLDETVPSALIIANYRKETGVPYMQANYPHTEVQAFGMHMMFHEYPDRVNELILDFLRRRIGVDETEWTI